MRVPVFFEAAGEPPPHRPLAVAADVSPQRFTWRVIFAAKKYTVPAALLTVLHQVGEALVPVIMGLAIDRALATGSVTSLLWWVLVLGVDFALLSFAFRFGSRIGLFGMQEVQHRLRMVVSDRLLHPSGTAGPASLPGTSLSIATNDVFILAAGMRLAVYPIGAAAGVVFCAVMLLSISWPLGLAVMIGAPLMLSVMGFAGAPLRRRSQNQQALAARAVGTAADLLGGYRVLKGIRAERQAASRYESVSQEALAGTLHAKNAQGSYTALMHFISGVFIAALAVGAAILAARGELTVGELIAVVGLAQFLIGPLRSLSSEVGAIWAMSVASAARVLTVLQAPHAVPVTDGDRAAAEPPRSDIELRGVELASGIRFDLHIEPDECVGIRASAEQARALVDVLTLHAPASAGSLLIGGVDVRELDPDAVRERVVVAPHEADLFDGTIEENVSLRQVDPERLTAAYEAACCEEIFRTFPDGRLTQVGEGGTRLSGGQRQRVALARAFATDAPVLVLHDPTTAVDSVTEAAIAAGITTVREGRCTIVIAASSVLLAGCDRLIELHERAGAR